MVRHSEGVVSSLPYWGNDGPCGGHAISVYRLGELPLFVVTSTNRAPEEVHCCDSRLVGLLRPGLPEVAPTPGEGTCLPESAC